MASRLGSTVVGNVVVMRSNRRLERKRSSAALLNRA
jgi:hypothetical protein